MTLDGYCELESDEWCDLHECKRPCEHCKDEQADRAFEDRRERIRNYWGLR